VPENRPVEDPAELIRETLKLERRMTQDLEKLLADVEGA
jgi:hypothetical protein